MNPKLHQILTLARAGNPVRAWALFEGQGLDDVSNDPKVLTLKGRLLKDQADRADGDERERLYREASAAYLAAYKLKTDTYPLINAATLALLAGDTAQPQTLAQQVLDLIQADPNEGETPYWREATRAEALLLLDQHRLAKEALSAGIALLPQAWEDHAATIAQFERIAEARDESAVWLSDFRPPCSVHFSGLIGLAPDDRALYASIQETVEQLKPGFAFGALAAGADIMLAEALTATGTQLHVTLPCQVEEFRAISVEPFGADWGQRFDALMDQAATCTISTIVPLAEENRHQAFERASLASMGHAVRQAEVLRSTSHAITIAAEGEEARLPIAKWAASSLPMTCLKTARANSSTYKTPTAPEFALSTALSSSNGLIGADLALGEALDQAANLIDGNTEIGLAIQLGGQEFVAELAAAALPGMTVCDWQTAMVAKIVRPDIRIEELGELRVNAGTISLWAIAP